MTTNDDYLSSRNYLRVVILAGSQREIGICVDVVIAMPYCRSLRTEVDLKTKSNLVENTHK